MLAALKGCIVDHEPGKIVILVGDQGYEVAIIERDLVKSFNSTIWWVHEHVTEREGTHLFGFSEKNDRNTFRVLLSVDGVGPKTAMSLLTRFTPRELAVAVGRGDRAILCEARGVGKKTADRIVLELADKFAASIEEIPTPKAERLVSGLTRMGFSLQEAKRGVDDAFAANVRLDADILRHALQFLAKG